MPLDETASPVTSPANPPVDSVSTINLRLPEFWPTDPAVWFAQVEAQFSNHKIAGQVARFNYVVASLPPLIAMEVRDFLLNRPPVNPYDALKAALIARTSASERQRLQQLLATEDLGDRKPTQMLRRMQQLLGDKAATFDEGLLKELFLQRLPANVRMILATTDTMSLQAVAEMADRILEVATPSIAAVSSGPASSDVTQLREEVAHLTELVQRLLADRTPSPSRKPRRRSPRRQSSPCDSGVCWYHQRFGDASTRCTRPCTYVSPSENPSAQH